ncbi:MAG: dihydropyrimidinase [Anaerolineaceae bacterium]|nr:dihydropyrimidinase [Anaerolineaceae bacterium]
MKTIICGGTIISASDEYKADILIEDGKIAQIGIDLSKIDVDEIIDANEKLVLPGGVDVHTHFDLPMFNTVSSDDHYSGHKAAAFGGTTTVIDFVPQTGNDLKKDIDGWLKKSEPKAAIDYGFHMNISIFNQDVADQIPGLIDLGITSLKVFTAYNSTLRLPDADIFKVMRIAKKYGFLTMLHAENGDIIEILVQEAVTAGNLTPEWHAHTRPAWGAVEAVTRGISFSAQTEAPLYIVHMNAAGEVDQLAYGRDLGLQVMGETCPQYLFFTVEQLLRPDGSKWICSPPMRSEEDNQRLWLGIMEGTIQVVGTDHCPFFFDGSKSITYEEIDIKIPGKELGKEDFTKIPNGLPGVGDRLPILWTEGVGKGRITPNQFVAVTATNPAKIFGLYPKKGVIQPGSDADIVIWDPNKRLTYGVEWSKHRTDYNLYEGWELEGYPVKVFLRGKCIVDGKKWQGNAGEGKFIKRMPFGQVI